MAPAGSADELSIESSVILTFDNPGDGGAAVTANVFDQAARYSVQFDPLGFLRWVMPGRAPPWRFRGWLDTRSLPFPGTPDRTCDTVADLAEDDDEAGRRW